MWLGVNHRHPAFTNPSSILLKFWMDTPFDCVSTQIPYDFVGASTLYAWVYDTLFYSPSGDWTDITGLLATDWTVSDDALTWTIQITEDAYFVNGNHLDATSVVDTIEYQMSLYNITNIVSIEAIADYTVEIQLTNVTSEFMKQFASANLGIFDVVQWQANLDAGIDTVDACAGIGSGPYYVSAYDLGNSLTFTANANYWCEDRYPHIETIFMPVLSDASTQQTVLQSGDAVSGVVNDWTVMENLVENYGLYYITDTGTYRSLWMNTSGYSECLTDPVVREALTMMIDFEEVSMALAGDYGAYGLNCFNDSIDYEHDYVCDPDAGLALLATTDYEPEDIVITALADSSLDPIFSNVQSQLLPLGITLNYTVQDGAAIMSSGMAGEWDIWAEHGGLGIGSYETNITDILGPNSAQNLVRDDVLGPIIADMVTSAFARTDNDETMEILADICAVAAENYLYLGSVAIPSWFIYSEDIINYTMDLNGRYWRPWNSWVA